VIGDTTLDTGMIYQIVTSDIPQVVPIRYVRVDSVTANVYRYESGQEWLTDSLLATTGSWFMGDNPTECTDVSIDTVLGVGTIVKRFVEHFVFGADYALGHGFGRTEHNSYNEDPCYPWLYTIERTLVYARIDGEVFGTFVGVAPDENGIPAQFLLEQNYPNPFNPSTTITFSLPRSGEVRLRVFNLLGEEVATLFSGHKDAGTHTVQWDATGQPSGVYFYRLRAGDFTQTRKLVLLR